MRELQELQIELLKIKLENLQIQMDLIKLRNDDILKEFRRNK